MRIIKHDACEFHRVNQRKYLNVMYADKPGRYRVLSEMVADFCGQDTVIAHVVRIGGKLCRFYLR